jgi:septation ring formation regulator EzrA
MTDQETPQAITFDGVEYQIDDLSDKAKYIISQLQDIRKDEEDARRALDRLQVCQESFTHLLGEELKSEDNDEVKTAEEYVVE